MLGLMDENTTISIEKFSGQFDQAFGYQKR